MKRKELFDRVFLATIEACQAGRTYAELGHVDNAESTVVLASIYAKKAVEEYELHLDFDPE